MPAVGITDGPPPCARDHHAVVLSLVLLPSQEVGLSVAQLGWLYMHLGWRSGVVVSALASINEVNQRRARLVLCPGSIPGAGHLFRYVTNQPPKANSAVHPSGAAWNGRVKVRHY